MRQRYSNIEMKPSLLRNIQSLPPQQEKVIVEPYRQCDSPDTYADNNNDIPEDGSEDETSDSALVIAEESNDSHSFASRGQKTGVSKKRPEKKDPTYAPRRGGQKKRTASKNPRSAKKKPVGNSKPLTAYVLWCTENRKKVVASMGNTGFGNIGKKLGETWQALPDKEKMAWRRKAKRIALKNSSGLISTGPSSGSSPKGSSRASSVNDDVLKGITEGSRVLGTSAIDSAAYLKLLGDSLSVIGQRLTEHEGQLAVSGIFSVLLDTILCVIGPLICLTSETPVLNSCPQEVTRRTLDSIAYFMPGL
ncbi:HMG box-containing protein 4-like [Stegodyphus dumicola]|uniref:HMG box-containing protein 4-like n=1 Tax=Stegodyphus dumicola TaxID=202533 RepID=UPI0015AF433C|nr:HMG box-containing protein 4-like [Stegodyphus dumicola]